MYNSPKISIVIPAHNEEDTIDDCLASIEKLNYPLDNLEAILVNDGSTDGTGKIIIESHMEKLNLTYIETPAVGASKARNIGIKKAHGEYIAFTDADCVVDEEWLNELLKGFINENVVSAGGSQGIPPNATEYEKKVHHFLSGIHFICDYMKEINEIKFVDHNASCNAMYVKDTVEEVGGFDEFLWPGEDVELDYKIRQKGYKISYNPKAIVFHHRPKSIKGLYKMMQRYGWSQAYLVRKYGVFRKLHYVPFAEVLILVFLGLIAVYNLYLFVFLVLVFFVVLFALSFRGGMSGGVSSFIMLIVTIVGWNVGFVAKVLKRHTQSTIR